jgi:hypothetical protein
MQKMIGPAFPGRAVERNEVAMQTEDVKPAYQAANLPDSELDSLMLYFEFSNGDIEIVRLKSITRITYIARSKAIAIHIPEGIIGLQGKTSICYSTGSTRRKCGVCMPTSPRNMVRRKMGTS